MKIELYSDGSGNTFDSDGGWGYCMVVDGDIKKRASGYIPKATNNVAELTAAIEGLKYVEAYMSAQNITSADVELVSDSQLVLGYASDKWKCKAIHLGPLKAELRQLYDRLSAGTRWVKGHSGDTHNEICDELAKNARGTKLGVSQ